MKTKLQKTTSLILSIVFISAVVFGQDWNTVFEQGRSAFDARKYSEAVEFFKRAIAIRPNVPEGHFNLGLSYFRLEQFGAAAAAFREAVRLKPDYQTAWVQLGNALDLNNQYAEALVAYETAKRWHRVL
ncbi:MAG: hypothetical protein C4324_06850 [Blastocatellia bacterium]